MDAEVSTHTFQTMIIEESVCFMSCEPIFFCNYSYVVHTEYIFISIFIFHSGIRAIISMKEFKSWVTCISFSPSVKSEKASNNKACVIPL